MIAKFVFAVSSMAVVLVACVSGGEGGQPSTLSTPPPRDNVAVNPVDGGGVANPIPQNVIAASDGGLGLGAACIRSSDCGAAFDGGLGAKLVCCQEEACTRAGPCPGKCSLPYYGNAVGVGECGVSQTELETPAPTADQCVGIGGGTVSKAWVDGAGCAGGHTRTAEDETFKAACEGAGYKIHTGCDGGYYCCAN